MASVENFPQRTSSRRKAAEHFVAPRSATPHPRRQLENPDSAKTTDTAHRVDLSHWRPTPLVFVDGQPPQYPIVKYQAPKPTHPDTDIRILNENKVFARTAEPVIFDFRYPSETVSEVPTLFGTRVVENVKASAQAIATGIASLVTKFDRFATQAVATIDATSLPIGLRYTDAPAVADDYAPRINRQQFKDPERDYAEAVAANPNLDAVDQAGIAFLLGARADLVSELSAQNQVFTSGNELSLLRPDAPEEEQNVVGKRLVQHGPAIIFNQLPDQPVGRVDPAVDKPALAFLQRKIDMDQLPIGEAHNGKALAVGTDKEGRPTHTEQVIITNVTQG